MDLFHLREPVSAWTHGAWLLLALPGAVLLWKRAAGNRPRQLVLASYVGCLAFCATASTVYHAVRLPADRIAPYLLLDHIGIYVLIAGTYTPIAWTLMRGRWRVGTLTLVWLAAALGTALHLACHDLPNWLNTSLYLAMGWGSVICYLELGRITSQRTLSPLVVGGALYSVGALIHVLDWPGLWPGVFGAHDVFHVVVIVASATHYRFMLRVVAPWEHPPLAASWTGREARARTKPAIATGSVLAGLPVSGEAASTRNSFRWPLES